MATHQQTSSDFFLFFKKRTIIHYIIHSYSLIYPVCPNRNWATLLVGLNAQSASLIKYQKCVNKPQKNNNPSTENVKTGRKSPLLKCTRFRESAVRSWSYSLRAAPENIIPTLPNIWKNFIWLWLIMHHGNFLKNWVWAILDPSRLWKPLSRFLPEWIRTKLSYTQSLVIQPSTCKSQCSCDLYNIQQSSCRVTVLTRLSTLIIN